LFFFSSFRHLRFEFPYIPSTTMCQCPIHNCIISYKCVKSPSNMSYSSKLMLSVHYHVLCHLLSDCSQHTHKQSSGTSIGIPEYLLQLVWSMWCRHYLSILCTEGHITSKSQFYNKWMNFITVLWQSHVLHCNKDPDRKCEV
jgi:hypothetical protein